MITLTAPVARPCSWDYPIWQIRSKSADPIYRFVQNNKAGYIDQTGKVLIKPSLEAYGNYSYWFEQGLLHTSVADAQYVDTSGQLVINKNYERGWDFSDGLAAALPENGKLWGYIDRSGEFVISPRFAGYPDGYVYSFSEGLALINVNKKYGYIDHSGEFVIPPKLLMGHEFHEGLARVVIEGPCGYSDRGPCPDFRMLGLSHHRQNMPLCKFTFIDKKGSVITASRFEFARDFSEGLAPVLIGEKWGYIDKRGGIVIKPAYDDAEEFSDGLARIQVGKLYGYIDHNGTLVIPAQFKRADKFADGLAPVSTSEEVTRMEDEVFFYINKTGKRAFDGDFALASHFFKGLAHVMLKSGQNKRISEDSQKRTFAYIDTSGKRVFIYRGEG